MNKTIKNCPFCGSNVEPKLVPEWSWASWWIICPKCKATFDRCFYTRDEVIEYWNNRVGDSNENNN